METLLSCTRKFNVLLVEDDEHVMQFLSRLLELVGFKVFSAPNFLTAREFAETESLDLALVDCNLGPDYGSDVVRYLHNRDASMPCIGMSGEHFRGQEMISAGTIDFVTKPIDTEEFCLKLHRLMSPT